MRYQRKEDGIFLDAKSGRLMEHQHYSKRIYWSQDMLDTLVAFFPTTLNEELAKMLGVSQSTMLRKARELGLCKRAEWLEAVWDERWLMAHASSKVNGNRGQFKKGCVIGKEYWFKPKTTKNL